MSNENNVIELKSKMGRNDLCYCGSGKKYKNCCLKKDQEEARINELLQTAETVSDKYFTTKEYVELSGYPIVKFDFFLLEILNIASSVLYKYNKTSREESKKAVKELYLNCKKFYNDCLKCENKCITNPLKKVNFKSLADNGVDIDEIPKKLQRGTAINFFYIEFINFIAYTLNEELCKVIDEETSQEISLHLYYSLLDYVEGNCIEKCDYECIMGHDESAYCKFCTFGKNKLLCPKDGDISYEEIKAVEEDMEH